jgi:hypothetical protein
MENATAASQPPPTSLKTTDESRRLWNAQAASYVAMTLVGSLGLGLMGSNLNDLIVTALVIAALLAASGTLWLLFGQRFEQPKVRLTVIPLLVLSIASLILVEWGIAGPLKDDFLKNPRLYEAVASWGLLLLLPLVVAWRLLVVSLWKNSRFDSVSAWLLLAGIALVLGRVSGPVGNLAPVIMLPVILPWLAIWALGVRRGWQPVGIKRWIPIMIASVVWGAVAGYAVFVVFLYIGFHGA